MENIAKLNWDPNLCNTYVIGNEGKPCIVVDPGDNTNGRLDRYIEKHHGSCNGILLTHGHYDHIQGLVDLKHLGPVFMMEDDIRCLTDSKYNLREGLSIDDISPYPLDDEDEIKIGNYIVKTIATPFHTAGSACFYIEEGGVLFTGDTLFHLSIGRTDLPSGSSKTVNESLEKLTRLPKETKVYPGHYGLSTLENEFAFNPFLSNIIKHR